MKFHANKARRDGLNDYCKSCMTRTIREMRDKNPEKYKKIYRRHVLKTKYNMTPEQEKELLDKQSNKCAICYTDFDEGSYKACIDHDHDTGLIRGILCQFCNKGLGHFKDSMLNINNAFNYLEKHYIDNSDNTESTEDKNVSDDEQRAG